MRVVLPAETAVFAECELLFHFFLVALGVVRDAAAYGTLEFHHRIFDLSHSWNCIELFTKKASPLYGKKAYLSTTVARERRGQPSVARERRGQT